MNKQDLKSANCLNCDKPLESNNFCAHCGQKNESSRITLGHFIYESVSHFFAFDGRVFHTLIGLFSKPGQVPLEYRQGKRMRYMNPLRLYFLSSILLLALAQVDFGNTQIVNNVSNNQEETAEADSIVESYVEDGIPVNVGFTNEDTTSVIGRLERMNAYIELHPEVETREALKTLQIDNTLINRTLFHQAAKTVDFNLEEFNNYLYSKLFWLLFFFLPLMALILKLLYIRRSFYYPEHLYFTFFTQSVFFLLMASIVSWNSSDLLMLFVVLAFAAYLLVSLKVYYQQSWMKTILKFVLINLISIPTFAVFFVFSTIVVFLIS